MKQILKKTISLCLAMVMLFGCIPAYADDPDDGMPEYITFTSADYGGWETYQSPYWGNKVYIHDFVFDVDGVSTPGFCTDHTKLLNPSYLGLKWSYDFDVAAEAYAYEVFLDVWYHQYKVHNLIDAYYPTWTDTEKEALTPTEIETITGLSGVSGYWSTAGLRTMAAVFQSAIWISLHENVSVANWTDILDEMAEEMVVVWEKRGITITFDDARLRLTNIFLSAWPEVEHQKYYCYAAPQSKLQPIIIPKLEDTALVAYLQIYKVDNTGTPISGVKFDLYYEGETDPFATVTTGADGKTPVQELDDGASTTYNITAKEVYVPDGYVLQTSPYLISVNGATYNTPDNPYIKQITNYKTTDPTPEPDPENEGTTGTIKKIDAKTGEGLAGAVFAIYGTTQAGKVAVSAKYMTTGADGTLTLQWSNAGASNYLAPGSYIVTESKAPNGYLKTEDYQLLTVWSEEVVDYVETTTWSDGEGGGGSTTDTYYKTVYHYSGDLTFKDYKYQTITIQKYDDTGMPASAIFEVRKNGELVDTITVTGSYTYAGDGDGCENGYYTFTEIASLDGKVIPVEHEQGIYIENKDTTASNHILSFTNITHPQIYIQKTDSITGARVAGAVFEILVDGTKVTEVTTNAYGYAIISSDVYGKFLSDSKDSWTISCREISPAAGYNLDGNDTGYKVAEIGDAQKTIEFIYQDSPYRSVVVEKTDSVTGTPLAGAKYKLSALSLEDATAGTFVEQIQETDDTGYCLFYGLPNGVYELQEITPPTDYLINDRVEKIVINSDTAATLTYSYTNDIKGRIAIFKTDYETGEPLEGAVYTVKDSTGSIIATLTTGTDGKAITQRLDPGEYTVQEKQAPDHYNLNEEEILVRLQAIEDYQLDITDKHKTNIVVKKVDSVSKNELEGATFVLKDSKGDIIDTQVTGTDGLCEFVDVEVGEYTLQETIAPDGYLLNDKIETIVVKNTTANIINYTFEDQAKGLLSIIKTDADTGEALAGAKFTVKNSDGTIIETLVTDDNGYAYSTKVEPGTYYVEEIEAPTGYNLDSTVYTVRLQAIENYELKITNKSLSGIGIYKVDSTNGHALAGATFAIKDSTGSIIETITTDNTGWAFTSKITAGTYQVYETSSPEGYILDDTVTTVRVLEGELYKLELKNVPMTCLHVTLTDESNPLNPVGGATYELLDSTHTVIGTFTTNEDGKFTTGLLEPGTYYVRMKTAATGYVLDDTEYSAIVKAGESNQLDLKIVPLTTLKVSLKDSVSGSPIQNVQFKVEKTDGTLVGTYKTNENGEFTVADLTEGDYKVTCIQSITGYSIIESELIGHVEYMTVTYVDFLAEPNTATVIKTVNSTTKVGVPGNIFILKDIDGNELGTYTTDANGLISLSLEPGSYILTPVKSASGYAFEDTNDYLFDVIAGETKNITINVTPLSSLRIKFVDGSTGAVIQGVRVLIKDGTTTILDLTSNNEGYINLTQSLVAGTYTVEMISAPDGYILDTMPKSVAEMMLSTTDIVWKLYKNAGQVRVTVTSEDYNATRNLAAGTKLQGAVFEVVDKVSGKVVSQMISDTSGVAASSGLPIGTYIVRQINAPAYYAINTTETEIQIKINNDLINLTYTQKSVNLKTTLAHRSNTSVTAGSSMRVDITQCSNDSDVALTDFFLHIKVPTDCARISTLTTGKWSADVVYKITYKTNMQDYRTLVDNLRSNANHSYDLSSTSLNLQLGEYVTDVMFVFDTVPAEFKLTTRPAYMLYVLSTVYQDYKLLSKLEMGGKYDAVALTTNGNVSSDDTQFTGTLISSNSNTWTTNTSQWTTKVNNSKSKSSLPSSLPKTGY